MKKVSLQRKNMIAYDIGGHGRTPPPGGSRWGGGSSKSIFEKPHFKRFAAKFFSKFSRRFSEGQKGACKVDL